LERDLDLDPLDLVLIALRIEGILRVEFPIAQLEWVRTVADITRIVRSIAEETSSAGVFARDAQLAVVA
jgi:acyl carrier protein